MELSGSTLCGWVAQTARVLEVLYDKLVELVLQSRYIQGDETTIRVQVKMRKMKTDRLTKTRKRKHIKGIIGFFTR